MRSVIGEHIATALSYSGLACAAAETTFARRTPRMPLRVTPSEHGRLLRSPGIDLAAEGVFDPEATRGKLLKRRRFARSLIVRHTVDMATATVKRLQRTGRLSRKKVRAAVARVLAEQENQPRPRKGTRIRASDTASGRGEIAFRFATPPNSQGKGAVSKRSTARKSR